MQGLPIIVDSVDCAPHTAHQAVRWADFAESDVDFIEYEKVAQQEIHHADSPRGDDIYIFVGAPGQV